MSLPREHAVKQFAALRSQCNLSLPNETIVMIDQWRDRLKVTRSAFVSALLDPVLVTRAASKALEMDLAGKEEKVREVLTSTGMLPEEVHETARRIAAGMR